MKKSTVGLLIGVGAAVAWFFRGSILARTFVRSITLQMTNDGCGVEQEPDPVKLSWILDDRIRWDISSPAVTGCGGQHEVCIGNWRLDGVPTNVPPVTNPNGLCRQIRQGNPPISVLAHINDAAPFGEYKYDILVDNVVVLDPIVKLTP
jgi:hypothetical protein